MEENKSHRKRLRDVGLINFDNALEYRYRRVILLNGSHIPPGLLSTNEALEAPSLDDNVYSLRPFDVVNVFVLLTI